MHLLSKNEVIAYALSLGYEQKKLVFTHSIDNNGRMNERCHVLIPERGHVLFAYASFFNGGDFKIEKEFLRA